MSLPGQDRTTRGASQLDHASDKLLQRVVGFAIVPGEADRKFVLNVINEVIETSYGAKTIEDRPAFTRLGHEKVQETMLIVGRTGQRAMFLEQRNDAPPGRCIVRSQSRCSHG